MGAWGKDAGIAVGLAYVCSALAWAAGGGDTAQAVVLVGTFPLHLAGVHAARVKRSAPTRPHPDLS